MSEIKSKDLTIIDTLQLEVRGEIKLVSNYKKIFPQIKENIFNINIDVIKNKIQQDNAFAVSRQIKFAQEKFKIMQASIHNQEILDFNNSILEINKMLASKNTEIKKALDTFKANEKNLIIETASNNIKSQPNFEFNDAEFKKFEDDCLVAFKGKSSFEEMQSIALKIAETYCSAYELNYLKFQNVYIELKTFCNEIGLVKRDDYLKEDALKIVLKNEQVSIYKEKYMLDIETMKAHEENKKLEQEYIAQNPITPPITDATTQKTISEDLQHDNAIFLRCINFFKTQIKTKQFKLDYKKNQAEQLILIIENLTKGE